MRMRTVSKMVTNPNGNTSSALVGLFVILSIGAMIGFFVSLLD